MGPGSLSEDPSPSPPHTPLPGASPPVFLCCRCSPPYYCLGDTTCGCYSWETPFLPVKTLSYL